MSQTKKGGSLSRLFFSYLGIGCLCPTTKLSFSTATGCPAGTPAEIDGRGDGKAGAAVVGNEINLHLPGLFGQGLIN